MARFRPGNAVRRGPQLAPLSEHPRAAHRTAYSGVLWTVLLRFDSCRAGAHHDLLAYQFKGVVGIHRTSTGRSRRRFFWLVDPVVLQLFPERNRLPDRLDALVALGARQAGATAAV